MAKTFPEFGDYCVVSGRWYAHRNCLGKVGVAWHAKIYSSNASKLGVVRDVCRVEMVDNV